MARKFSLKDNPIFQRLELPTPHPLAAPEPEENKETEGLSAANREQIKFEDQNQTLKNRPSIFGSQNISIAANDRVEVASIESSLNRGETTEHPQERNINLSERQEVVDNDNEGQILTLNNRPSTIDPTIDLQKQATSEEPKQINFPEEQGISDDHRKDQLETETYLLDKFDHELSDLKVASTQEIVVENSTTPQQNLASFIQVSQKNFEEPSSSERNDKHLDLREHIEKSLFFTFYNEVSDHLLPTLEPSEQVLYARLFRLSYGFNKNYCTVSHPLLQERTGLSRNTVRTSLQSLLKRGLVSVINAGKHIATTYRVYLPSEKSEGSKFDPQSLTLKNRGSKKGFIQGQISALQISALNKKKGGNSNKDNSLHTGESKIDPQNLTPLLSTNNSLTLPKRELSKRSTENISSLGLAKKLVTDFYANLSLTPSSEKIARGTAECCSLLEQGFTESQIRYATEWIITHHSDTGSFSRITHFIDQSLKAREEEERNKRIEHQKRTEHEFKKKKEKEIADEERRIEKIRTSLGQNELAALQQEASQLVESEHGNVRFGKETLVQLKVRELIREKFPLPKT